MLKKLFESGKSWTIEEIKEEIKKFYIEIESSIRKEMAGEQSAEPMIQRYFFGRLFTKNNCYNVDYTRIIIAPT